MAKPKSIDLNVFKKICADIASGQTIKKACGDNGTNATAYYSFLHENMDNADINELSMRARMSKAHSYFDKAEEVLEEIKDVVGVDIQKARLQFDGYLRLAGKANQGLYGEKQETIHSGCVKTPFEIKIVG